MRRSLVTIICALAALAVLFGAYPAAAQSPYFVKMTSPGYEGSPRDLVAMNGIGYFASSSATNFSTGQSDEELWRTDGTAAGTYLVKDIRPGASGSNIQWMTVAGSTLYFSANDGTRGTELWKSDGTTAGTQLVLELNVGSGDGYIASPIAFNGALYFIGTYANGKTYLFKSDGTAAGTQPVSTAVSPVAPTSVNTYRRLTVWNNRIWFYGNDAVTFAAAASGLYSTDGTSAGTTFVKTIPSMGSDLIAASGQLFFTASDATFRREVWRSDGTAAGTFMVKDINPFNSGFNGDSSAWLYQTVGNVALFSADDGTNKRKMWRSDGTPAGTYLLVDIFPGANEQPNNCTTTGAYAVWEAVPPTSGPRQVWVTDGTSAGTRLLKAFSGFGQNFVPMDGVVYFRADDGPPAGDELWRTDGTVAGTFLYADIYPGTGGSDPYPIGFVGNHAYLSASGTAATAFYHQLWAFQMCNSSPRPAVSVSPGAVCPNGASASANVTNGGSFNSFAWTIVNGAIDSPSSTAPGVTFHATSSNPVLLTVTATAADGCANRTTVTVPITVLPAPVITVAPNTLCPNATIASANVTNYSSPTTFLWTIANGAFDSGPSGPAVGFHATGASPVQLTLQVTDANGCKATGTVSVPIVSIAAPAISLATADMCPGSTDTASIAGSWASVTWSITNGARLSPNGLNSVTFTAASTPATVSVSVTDANGCTATNSVQVPIRSIPPPVITLSGADMCPGSNDTASVSGSWAAVTWTVTNGAIIGPNGGSSLTFTAASTPATVSVRVTDAGGCTATNSVQVPIRSIPPPVITLTGADMCPGSNDTASVPGSWAAVTWTVTNGAIIGPNGGSSVTFTAASTAATVSVVVTDAGGCTATNSVQVPIRSIPPPAITLSGADMCPGSNDIASVPGSWAAVTWTVTNGAIVGPNGGSSVTFTAVSAPTVTVVVTDAGGCSATSSITVPIRTLPAPVVTASGPTTFCEGGSVTLTAPAGYSYNWSNGATARSIAVTAGGSYSVTVHDAGGCSAGSATTSVTVNPLPEATIAADGPASFCAGGNVTLTASAASSYLWSNGATSQSIVVTQSGAYSVTVTNASGCSKTSSATAVTVNALPNATINADGPTTFCTGGSVNLSAPAGAAAYLWSTGATTQTIHVAPSSTTAYSVTITDANGCSASASQSVNVYPPPSAAIAPSHATTFCEGGNVTLFGSGSGSYLWSTGATTPQITVAASGTYTLTVTNSLCSATASIDVTVLPAPPKPVIAAGGPLTFCAGGSVTLTAPDGYTYSWSNPAGATTRSITATASGNYMVTVVSENGCSSTSDVVTVTVPAVPATPVVTAGGPLTFCDGGSVTLTAPAAASYLWSNGATTQSVAVTASGTYSVTVTNASGCSSAASAPSVVTVNAAQATPSIAAGGPTTFCEGGSVTLTAPAGSSYLWSNGATTQSITATASGNYSVTVTNGGGCSATSTATSVTVNSNPAATIGASGPTTFCAGGSVTLTASASASYLWSNGATTQSIVATASGSYSVTTTNASGCSTTSAVTSVTVNANPTPAIAAGGPTTFCAGGSVTLTASAATSYLWSNGATTQSITATASGNYSVTVTNGSGCSTTSAPTAVTVNANPTATTTASGPTTFCAGGSVTLTASAGASYLWSTGATTQSIAATSTGDYTVAVTNAAGCTTTAAPKSITVNPNPAKPVITAGGPTTFCQGGSVTLTAPAGYATYFWSNGATTQSVTIADSRSVTVTVSNGSCSTASDPVSVSVWGYPDATITPFGSMPFCPGGGTLTLASPQSGTYTYLWSTGETTANINVHYAGTYSVTITNQAGCSSTSQPFVVTTYTKPTAVVSGGAAICSGGSATVRADLTGTAPWKVTWSDGLVQTGVTDPVLLRTVTPVTSTNYSISQLQDAASNCVGDVTGVAAITINAGPSTPTIGASGPTTFCAGGSVTLTATAASSYLWSNGATTQSIPVTASGSYSVTVTNASGCSSAPSNATVVSVTPPPATPTITSSGPTTICAGGSVTLTAPSSWSYLWSNGATSQSIVVTAAGSYGVTVQNASGCSSAPSAPVTVTVTANTSSGVVTASGPTTFCAGGSVTLTAPSAVSYRWSNGATTQSIVVTAAGSYSVTTTNASGCSDDSPATLVTVNTPPAKPAIAAGGPATFCQGGSVTLTAPAGYASYLWSNGATTRSTTITDTRNVTVTVSNGNCSIASDPFAVTVVGAPDATVFTTGAIPFCPGPNGGSVILSTWQSTGWTHRWSTGETTPNITVTAAGTYTVTITNQEGCASTSQPVVITTYTKPGAVVSGTATMCGASATIRADLTGTAPWSVTWSDGFVQSNVASSPLLRSVSPSSATTYSIVQFTDGASNCVGDATGSATITPVAAPATPAIAAGGPTTFCAGGSVTLTAPVSTSYLWSTGATTRAITVTTSGNYTVTVSNVSGCTATSAAKAVVVNAVPAITGFSPTLQTVTRNHAAQRITATATGTSLTYQWYSGTSPSTTTPISGATANSYLPPTATKGTFKYWVRVTNGSGCTANSATATLTVN